MIKSNIKIKFGKKKQFSIKCLLNFKRIILEKKKELHYSFFLKKNNVGVD